LSSGFYPEWPGPVEKFTGGGGPPDPRTAAAA